MKPIKKRIVIHAPEGEPMSLWAMVDHADPAKPGVKLIHKYDFTPTADWVVEIDDKTYTVESVEATGRMICHG